MCCLAITRANFKMERSDNLFLQQLDKNITWVVQLKILYLCIWLSQVLVIQHIWNCTNTHVCQNLRLRSPRCIKLCKQRFSVRHSLHYPEIFKYKHSENCSNWMIVWNGTGWCLLWSFIFQTLEIPCFLDLLPADPSCRLCADSTSESHKYCTKKSTSSSSAVLRGRFCNSQRERGISLYQKRATIGVEEFLFSNPPYFPSKELLSRSSWLGCTVWQPTCLKNTTVTFSRCSSDAWKHKMIQSCINYHRNIGVLMRMSFV